MSLKLVWMALETDLYGDKPCAKLLLISLCNFAQEDGRGWAATKTLAKHASCTPQYVRKLKRLLAKDGLCETTPGGGRGNASKYQINIDLLQSIATKKGETELPLLNSQRGNPSFVKGKLSRHKGETGGAPIGKKDIKGRAREAHTALDDDQKVVSGVSAGKHDIGAQAHVLRQDFEAKFGERKARSWFDQCVIDASNAEDIKISAKAFVKGRLENECETWFLERGAVLLTACVDQRASK